MKFLYTALLLLCATQLQAAHLPHSALTELKKIGIPQDAIGVEVREVGKSRALIEINSQRAMNPASTMKLVTTYAALDLLGPAYTWKTEAYLDGTLKDGVLNGNLIIKGYGDPKFTVEQFWLWLNELRSRGLREIRGDLIFDRSYYDLPSLNPAEFDNDPARAYNVGPDALLINFNTLRFRYMPDANSVRIVSEPPIDGIKIDNQLKLTSRKMNCDDWDEQFQIIPSSSTILLQGEYPSDCGEKEQNLSVMPHARYDEAVFRALWRELGGTLKGKQRDGTVGSTAVLFSTHRSEPLSGLIRDINKFSNNVMARQLFLTLGATEQASITRSTQVVRSWLQQQKLDMPELVLENGAGLSRKERITPSNMARLLQSAYEHPLSAELQASLPILGVDGSVKKRLKKSPAASHAHLKTGTLSGVKTIAGYVRSQSGKEWIVVFFINHANAQQGQDAQDALIEWVQQQ
ncbi:MAG: D-alanyl-D-alanine carboxypeptidase/D-alanyl-D-alanine-endopeptidase [Sideroxydans sp.]|nr:D-alanyl-D-alanine carboxypeptidase/D-alanyl-D-alanine-endopeptidase [Sideroxydans sp.]